MTVQRMRSAPRGRGLWFGYIRREGGNVAALMALLLVPLIGALSMAVEASSWFFMSRAAQNAADSAAVAAANNGASAEYQKEGLANALQYGFADGSNGVTVTVSSGQKCPDNTTTCYRATVTRVVPIYLTRVIGFNGDTALSGGRRGKTITSTALAEPINAISFPSCITALGSDTSTPKNNQTAISGDGTPNANAAGCSLSAAGPSPSSISCTGSAGLGALYGFATGTISGSGNNTCVTTSTTNSNFVFCDPYAVNPASGCPASSYATAVTSAVNSASTCGSAPSTFKNLTLGAAVCYNGNVTLDANLNPSTPTVIVLNGGNLNMGNFSSNNITFIFKGSTPGTIDGSGNVNITAPSTGNLAGIAGYQIASSACTKSNCDSWTMNGNGTVNVTGVLYLPYTNGSFGGNVQLKSGGNCFIALLNSFATNGTGYVLDMSKCKADGVGALPSVLRYRAALVQ